MRTNYVLIDYENKPQVDIDAIEKALPGAQVMLFVGAVQKCLPTELVVKILNLNGRGHIIHNEVPGKNAVDMVIAMRVAELAAEHPTAYFHIVSADKDFDALIGILKTRKRLGKRHSSVADFASFCHRSIEEIVETMAMFLTQGARPTTPSKLRNSVKQKWKPYGPSEYEIEAVVARLEKLEVLVEDGDKVTYLDKPAI